MTTACDFEPLERLARFSWERAPALCRPEHGCANYHQTWSFVRLLQLDGGLPAGAGFFRRELGALARAGRKRVLVCGGADTGVTALVVDSYRRAGVQPHITFVDRCETPCEQNRMLLRELGLEGDVRCIDALQLAGGPFDAVVWHSFLHFFDGAQRAPLLRAWANVLEPDGVMLVSTPLAPNDAEWQRIADSVAIEERRHALVDAAVRAGWQPADAQELGIRASGTWSVSARRPPALTRQALVDSLAQAGFRLRSIELHDPAASPSNLGTRPGKRRNRAEVAAVLR